MKTSITLTAAQKTIIDRLRYGKGWVSEGLFTGSAIYDLEIAQLVTISGGWVGINRRNEANLVAAGL